MIYRTRLWWTAACVGFAAIASPAFGQLRAGDHYPANIETPLNYEGVNSDFPVSGWSYTLTHPGATYIAVHFADFDLAPGDYLIVSDPSGEQRYTMEGRGKMNAGTFWARHINGDTMLLELVQSNPEGGSGFLIDEYVGGFITLDDRAICGADDKENAKCYELTNPVEYDKARAVARLLSNGSGFCTGWLVSSQNHIITNEHCVSSASAALNTDFDFMAEAPTCGTPNCDDCYNGTIFSGATFIKDSANLDYCLMQITSGDPASQFGYLEIDNRTAIVGEEIYIVGHPGGRAKEMTMVSTHSNDPTGIPVVYSITSPPCAGSGYNDVGYFGDTEGGSSGSPVLARSSHKVIALHHCANCPNRGVPITLVYAEIAEYLYPGPTGQLELDSASVSCDGTLGVEIQDGDIGASGTHFVTASATGGDSETFTVYETGADTAIFVGEVVTGPGSPVTADGILQVAEGDTVTVTYVDANNGSGGTNIAVSQTAMVDCTPPAVLSVTTTDVQPRSAQVRIDSDGLIYGAVHYGNSCSALDDVAESTTLANPAYVDIDELADGQTWFYAVEAIDEAGNATYNDNSGNCYTLLTPDVPDYFTELFSSFDLDNTMLTFVPDGSFQYYVGCVESISELPTDPNGGTVLTLSDDESEAVALGGADVFLYGQTYGGMYVSANGYLTFTGSDTEDTESLANHFDQPRISALFDDLDPTEGGTVSYEVLADRVVVTWFKVHENGVSNENTFQIEMFTDGMIRIAYLDVAVSDGLAGLSEGGGVPSDYFASNLSGLGACGPRPPSAISQQMQMPVNATRQITLTGRDDGLPDPPAAISFVVASLPTQTLIDSNNGHEITAGDLPYVIQGEPVLTYQPALFFQGSDSFLFQVDDGGVAPEGGLSTEAIVQITVGGIEAVYSDDFSTDPGWSTEGLWAWGIPTGGGDSGGYDPTSGHTGDHVYGYNLEGDYTNNMPIYSLTTPALDLSKIENTELRFWRWLGVESSNYDDASVQISDDGVEWTTIWAHSGGTVSDSSWSQMVFDISDYADDEPHVWIRWTMGPTDRSLTYQGWNIDDFEIWGLRGMPGDWDGNGNVDLSDFARLPDCMTGPGADAIGVGCGPFDADRDGDVDMADCAIMELLVEP